MEGGFQTNKEAEYDEEVAIVLLPSMQKIEVEFQSLGVALFATFCTLYIIVFVCVDRLRQQNCQWASPLQLQASGLGVGD